MNLQYSVRIKLIYCLHNGTEVFIKHINNVYTVLCHIPGCSVWVQHNTHNITDRSLSPEHVYHIMDSTYTESILFYKYAHVDTRNLYHG